MKKHSMSEISFRYARALSHKYGRKVLSPYRQDGMDGSDAEQLPMRWADTGEPVRISEGSAL